MGSVHISEWSMEWISTSCIGVYTGVCLIYTCCFIGCCKRDTSDGNKGAARKQSQQYTLVDSNEENTSSTSTYSVLPRYHLWVQQLNLLVFVFAVGATIIVEIYLSHGHQKEVTTVITQEANVIVVLVCELIALVNDYNRYNMPPILKLLWLPVYVIGVLHGILRLYLYSSNMINTTICLYSVGTVFGIIAVYCACHRFLVASDTMPISQTYAPPSEYTCNLYQYLTFSFINEDLVSKISLKDSLELDEIPSLGDSDHCDLLYRQLEMDSSKKMTNGYLTRKVYFVVRDIFWVQQVLQVCGSILCYVPPIALRVVLNYVSMSSKNEISSSAIVPLFDFNIWIAVFLSFGSPLIKSLIDGQIYWLGRRIAIRSRACLLAALYSKIQDIDINDVADQGMINTCISSDITEVTEFACYFHFFWCSAFEVVLCVMLLYLVLGFASLAGVAVMVFVTGVLGRYSQTRFEKYQKDRLEQKDKRMNIIGEVLSGIRIIKWFTWEENFLAKIAKIRSVEIGHLKNFIHTDVIQRTMYSLLPSTVGLVSFVVHTQVLHLPLDPSVGFTSLLLFSLLRRPLQIFPDMISSCAKAILSLGRITKLLNVRNVVGLDDNRANEVPPSTEDHIDDQAIVFTNVTLAYCSSKQVLDDENVKLTSSCQSCLSRCCVGQHSPESSDKSDIEEGIELNPLVSTADISAATVDDTGNVVLKGLDFVIPSRALVAVTGLTGSGKSTLLLGVLGECRRLSGEVTVNDSFISTSNSVEGGMEGCGLRGVSYVSQNAWIQNATIRENVLMGNEYNESRYKAVLKACALELDLVNMTNGDLTEIGERGVNLSGGQQQRVNLARAAYSHSSIILMDDPLSAVDAHVGDYIFNHLICEFLQDRTRVLVTHAISLVVPRADLVIMLNNDKKSIEACCAPRDLQSKLCISRKVVGTSSPGVDPVDAPNNDMKMKLNGGSENVSIKSIESIDRFMDLLIDSTKCKVQSNTDSTGSATVKEEVLCEDSLVGDSIATSNHDTGCSTYSEVSLDNAPSGAAVDVADSAEFIEKEFKAKGTIKWNVYWFYLSACGGIVSSVCLILADVSVPLAQFLQNYTLGEWINDLESDSSKKDRIGLTHYLLCVAFVAVCIIVKFIIQTICSLRAAQGLHNDLTKCILLATTNWHDKQPLGRKINRFSQDVETIDCSVMQRIQDFVSLCIDLTQVVCVIVIMLPIQLLFLIPILINTRYLTSKYIYLSRELKRLESVSKSPVFVHFSETMSGLPTIRAYRKKAMFYDKICHYVDQMNRCNLYNWSANRWLNIRTQVMGALVSGVVSLFVVVERDHIASTLAGIILLYSLQFTDSVTWTTRCYAECQNSMNSVERIQEYCDIEQERYLDNTLGSSISGSGDANLVRRSMTDSWPVHGTVSFNKLCLQYRASEPQVLKEVSFAIEAGMKVGIVGRSGAGKSSILTALFRTTEPCSGEIWIDGRNILTLPLQDIRSKLAIVPQDPTLFRGSVKSNLDPFDECTDEDMWDVLRKCKLSSYVAREMDGGMKGLEIGPLNDKMIADKGSNLSVGQRQLLCLARAMLRKSKILILDEATASVDAETDACLQDTVRNEFSNVTVISIAHRLKTVAFYDKILVMDAGRVHEYDTPESLLSDTSSLFYHMAEKSGELQQLRDIAMSKVRSE